MTEEEMFMAAVEMRGWYLFVKKVDAERDRRWKALQDKEANRMMATLDMTPEGFVQEWDRRGRTSNSPLEPWEHAYNRAGLIQAAADRGYISIGRNVACTLTLEPLGQTLLAEPG